jgi:hypothetical protein
MADAKTQACEYMAEGVTEEIQFWQQPRWNDSVGYNGLLSAEIRFMRLAQPAYLP